MTHRNFIQGCREFWTLPWRPGKNKGPPDISSYLNLDHGAMGVGVEGEEGEEQMKEKNKKQKPTEGR